MKKMKLLLSLILGYINITSGSLLSKLNDVASSIKPPGLSVEEKIVFDITQVRRNDSIVVVTDQGITGFSTGINSDGSSANGTTLSTSPPITNLQPGSLTNQTLEDLKVLNLKQNRNSFYILLLDDQHHEKIKLVDKIQSVDYQSKIAIIYRKSIDVVGYYKNLGIYNIFMYVVDNYKFDASYRIYDVCRFCFHGEDKVELVNTWRYKSGFMGPVRFRNSFRGNAYGAPLRMGTYWLKPNIYIAGKDDEGNIIVDGSLYRRHKWIADSSNFSMKFVSHTGKARFNPVRYAEDFKSGKTDFMTGGWVWGGTS